MQSSSPDAALLTTKTKSKPATVGLHVWVRITILYVWLSFCQGKQPVCNMIYKQTIAYESLQGQV